MTEKNKCCSECRAEVEATTTDWDIPTKYYTYCHLSNCQCHQRPETGDGSVRCCDNGDMDEQHDCQRPETEWEKRLTFASTPYEIQLDGRTIDDLDILYSFINNLIQAAEQRERKAVLEDILAFIEKAYEFSASDPMGYTCFYIKKLLASQQPPHDL